jgi:hypothetical protein
MTGFTSVLLLETAAAQQFSAYALPVTVHHSCAFTLSNHMRPPPKCTASQ